MGRIVASREYWEKLKEIGNECSLLRISLGITQEQVAKETNSTAGYISLFEHGKVNSAIILNWYIRNGYRG